MSAAVTSGKTETTLNWNDRDAVIHRYLPLVRHAVRRMGYEGGFRGMLDTEDLLSLGTIGLLEAIDRFDPTRGVGFEGYALLRIRGSILDGIRGIDPLPRSVRQRSREIERTRSSLSATLEREPTVDEICSVAELTADSYRKTLAIAGITAIPLDSPSSHDDGESGLGGVQIVDPNSSEDFEEVERAELVEAVAGAVANLPERELLIVSLHYQEGLSLGDVARVMGISASRVSQIHARAIGRLRAAMLPGEAA